MSIAAPVFAAPVFAALALAAAPVQEEAPEEWPFDEKRLRGNYAEGAAYLAQQEAACEAARPQSRACLHMVFLRHYLAHLYDEHLVAAQEGERYLKLAGERDALGDYREVRTRLYIARSMRPLIRAGKVFEKTGNQLALEQISTAIAVVEKLDADPGILSTLYEDRGDVVYRIAFAEIFNMQRRGELFALAEDEFRSAVQFAERTDDPSDSARSRLFNMIAKTLFERELGEDAMLAADSAVAYAESALAGDDELSQRSAIRLVREMALKARETGYAANAVRYWETILPALAEGTGDLQLQDIFEYATSLKEIGEVEDAASVLGETVRSPELASNTMGKSFVFGRYVQALQAVGDDAATIAAAREAIAFAEARIAAGDYEAPFNALRMKSQQAIGEILYAQERFAEAEPFLQEAREYRVVMAFRNPTDAAEITADLLLAKSISRGSGDFRMARSLLKGGMDAAVLASQTGTGFDPGSQALLRSYAPLFREQVRIAYALARQDADRR